MANLKLRKRYDKYIDPSGRKFYVPTHNGMPVMLSQLPPRKYWLYTTATEAHEHGLRHEKKKGAQALRFKKKKYLEAVKIRYAKKIAVYMKEQARLQVEADAKAPGKEDE